jgi:hypothetical protein
MGVVCPLPSAARYRTALWSFYCSTLNVHGTFGVPDVFPPVRNVWALPRTCRHMRDVPRLYSEPCCVVSRQHLTLQVDATEGERLEFLGAFTSLGVCAFHEERRGRRQLESAERCCTDVPVVHLSRRSPVIATTLTKPLRHACGLLAHIHPMRPKPCYQLVPFHTRCTPGRTHLFQAATRRGYPTPPIVLCQSRR